MDIKQALQLYKKLVELVADEMVLVGTGYGGWEVYRNLEDGTKKLLVETYDESEAVEYLLFGGRV